MKTEHGYELTTKNTVKFIDMVGRSKRQYALQCEADNICINK